MDANWFDATLLGPKINTGIDIVRLDGEPVIQLAKLARAIVDSDFDMDVRREMVQSVLSVLAVVANPLMTVRDGE